MELNTEKLKSIELDILREFIKICEENSLQYFMVGGSALGAVRHKGFIPWDDDIDVGMPREDYEKFLTVAQERLPSPLFLQSYRTDKNYPNIFAKIRNSDTTFVEKTVSHLDMNHGVYIDIFPLDGHPKDPKKEKRLRKKERILKMPIYDMFLLELKQPKWKARLKKMLCLLLPKYQACVEKLDCLYQKVPYCEAETMASFGGAWGMREVMPRRVFGKGSVGEFEGMRVMLPEYPEEYLTLLYGDFRKLPPEEERVAHHFCSVIDLERSYKDYL